MPVGVLSLYLHFPGCASLKEKRSIIRPLLARLHKEFNLSAAEMGLQDQWQESLLACAMVSNDNAFLHAALQQIVDFLPRAWPDVQLLEHHIEII